MKHELPILEFKSICKLFYEIGHKKGEQLGVSVGRLQDRGEEIAPTFTNLWDDVNGGKFDELIKNESMLMKLADIQNDVDKHMEQFDREEKIRVAEAIEVLRKFVITA